ncbi:MAG: ABC transporter ATP-binding protein [Anaerolineae bacterium]|nr:ABC transporter ATP-binding protein [Anaerolineae bacterium]
MPKPLLRMEGITKIFPGVVANHNVNLTVQPGEIHALLGENGAGKSTLMNILSGLTAPDAGHIYWQEQPVQLDSPHQAARLGIGMVHQKTLLIPVFTALENIILTARDDSQVWIKPEAAARSVQPLLDELGLAIDLNTRIEALSPGIRQWIELIKALYRGAFLLILDEPTAILTPGEAERLFGILRRLVDSGRAVIFISHKLDEVMAISDRVTIMRQGHTITTLDTRSTNKPELAALMVGHAVALDADKPPIGQMGDPVIELIDVEGPAPLQDISLTVHTGEIVGIAGVDGNGQSALLDVLCGLRHPSRGRVIVQGADVTHQTPRDIYKRVHIGYIPEDRLTVGLVQDMSVQDNLILRQYNTSTLSRGGFLRHGRIKAFTTDLAQRFDLRAASMNTPVGSLSGGNQQKVILARELYENPTALTVANPTAGLDVGAALSIHQALRQRREQGTAILLISSDLEEIVALSDRIAVLHNGMIMGIVPGDAAERTRIGLMMAGTRLADIHP